MKFPKKQGSIRRAGILNIAISIFVAASTYYSLTLIAMNFGGGVASDGYFFLTSITTLASGLIGSLLGAVFLPKFVGLLKQTGNDEAGEFASSVFSWSTLLTCAAAVPIFIWNEEFFLLVSRFDASQISLMHPILIYFAPVLMFSVVAEYFRITALSLGKFSVAAVTALFPPVFVIGFLLGVEVGSEEQALISAALWSKIAALAVLAFVVQKSGIKVRFNFQKNYHTLEFLKKAAPFSAANVITNTANFYFDYTASGLGIGVVSALTYAQRIFILPITVILNPLVEIARTRFANYQADGNIESFNFVYNKLVYASIIFFLPVSAIYLILNIEIVSILFQRGAFQADDVIKTASFLSIYALSIPFVAIFLINGRACESYQRLVWPSVFGTLGNLGMLGLTFILAKELGFYGIPMAKVFTDIFYFFPFGFLAFKMFGGAANYKNVLGAFAKGICAALLSYYILEVVNGQNNYNGNRVDIGNFLWLSFQFLLVYVLLVVAMISPLRERLSHLLSVKI